MISLFIKEFCNKKGVYPTRREDRRYARIVAIDSRGRCRTEFVITRTALPKSVKAGDKVEIVKGD